MALQTDAIESRLEGLKQDDRRMMFDSKIRAFRLDSKAPALAGSRATKAARGKPDPQLPVEQMISLLEELSRRIDGLERKDRALGEEIRRRARQDHRRRSICLGGSLFCGASLYVCWLMKWL
jgi:hypothetical protein